MRNNIQGRPFPGLVLPSWSGGGGIRGDFKIALALAAMGAAAATLVVFAPWSIFVAGAAVVLVLSVVENEPFLWFIIFAMPIGWAIGTPGEGHDVAGLVRDLVVAGFFLGRFWRGQIDVRWLLSSKPARGALFFFGAIILSLIFAPSGWRQNSLSGLHSTASQIGFFFFVIEWVDSRERLHRIISTLFYSTILTAVFALLQEAVGGYTPLWFRFYPPTSSFQGWDGRATSFLAHANFFAGYLNLVLPFALACCLVGSGKLRKLGGWTLGLGIPALVCTQSLGGLTGFTGMLVLAIFFFAGSRWKKVALLVSLFTLIALLYGLRAILNPTHSETTMQLDLLDRLLLWQIAWNFFTGSPVTGVGWGNFLLLYFDKLPIASHGGVLTAHELYLQLLAETGLVGFAAFFYFIFQSWRQGLRQFRSSNDFLYRVSAFGALGAIISVLGHGFMDFFFTVSSQFGTLFWLVLALVVTSGASRLGQGRQGLECSPQYTEPLREPNI